jgi:hypothetical protein
LAACFIHRSPEAAGHAGGFFFGVTAYMLGRWVRSPGESRERPMPRKGVTGHDEWVIAQALATALVALEQLPPKFQPKAHMEDLKKLLMASCQPGSANLHLAQAKCKLFPDKDPLSIYQEYGMEGGRE